MKPVVYSLSQFKAVLHGLGYRLLPDEPDGNRNNLLDLRTQAAIREFQVFYRLPLTGTPDATTQEKARQLVRNLQHSLNLVINAQLPISEFYGPRTTRAVQRFQQRQGLQDAGIANLQTRHQLEEAVKQHLREQMHQQISQSGVVDWSPANGI